MTGLGAAGSYSPLSLCTLPYELCRMLALGSTSNVLGFYTPLIPNAYES